MLKIIMIVFVLFFALSLASSKIIGTKAEKHIAIEVGQSYEENVPLLFKQFQHTRLEEVKRDTTFYEKPICKIKLSESGLIRLVTQLDYNSTNYVTLQDKIVYQFEQLKSLRTFLDAFRMGPNIIVAYSTEELIIYALESRTGVLKMEHKISIPAVQQATFTHVNNQLLLFTTRGAFAINLTSRSCTSLSGYQPQESVGEIQSLRSEILIGEGSKGLAVYHFNQQNSTLQPISRTTFTVNSTPFDADTLQIDPSHNIIYVLDREEGVIAAQLTQLGNSTLEVSKMWILMGGCQNLLMTEFHLYLTCPELIQFSKKSGQPLKMQHNSFYPYEIQLVGQRLFLYGHQDLAVYDLFGNVLEEHQLHMLAQKSFIIQDFIVSFTDSYACSSLIVPQREELYCYTSDADRAGRYKGSYTTTGLCSEYFESPQLNREICEVIYPFVLEIQNSALTNYRTEVLIILVWAVIMAILAIAFAISNYIAHSNYRELVEEESRDNLQAAPKMKPKQESFDQIGQ